VWLRIAFLVIFAAPAVVYFIVWSEHDATTSLALLAHAGVGAIVFLVVRRYERRAPRPLLPNIAAPPESDDAVLAALGIATGDGELKAACARIARRLHSERIRVVGFVPSDNTVAVPPVIIQLGLSLCELTGATVAVVDANVRYPGLGALNQGKQTDSDETVFSTRWLRGSLALLSPPRVEHAGEVVPQLARVLLDGSDLFAHVLVDSPVRAPREHGSAAAAWMRSRSSARPPHRERAVELAPLMPQDRFLGILLVLSR
jgi:hypothetical protein